jgi:3'-phosphoadenosine 5'-phosphosulfate sulfotransferase (PAPS reductase)/FAD synthetase/formate hydrogenlyase subunit 6/NADH:ubiquinone oxidoreductase subunit I
VIYSDTGYELPPSLALYQEIEAHYKKLYPELKFSTVSNHETVLNYWDKIGTPSDTHRWCCSVMKTAPLYRSLKMEGTNRQARVLTFDGVRAEESTRRSNYSRISKGVKHNTVINASPILEWNATEIFLYLFKYDLPINPAYRQGKARVGCIICPYSSKWDDMIANSLYKEDLKPFLTRIESSSKNMGIQDVEEYIKSKNWKLRAGGREIKFPSFMEVISVKPDLIIKCHSPQKDILTWLIAVGEYSIKTKDNHITGEIKYQKLIFNFSITLNKEECVLTFENTANYPVFQGLLKRAFYKSTYCINCESCEVECPTGALSILPDASINAKKCTHCHNCLEFHDFGCVVANSLYITDNNKKNNMKLISYNTFGLNGEWLDVFFSSTDTYFSNNNHGLHPRANAFKD